MLGRRWLTMHGADGRFKEGHWRCGDAGEFGMTDIPMSSRLCIWRGRRGDRIWMKVAGNGREDKLIWDSFWSICPFSGGGGGPRQADTGWSSARVSRESCHAGSAGARRGRGMEEKRKNPGETWQGSIAAPFVCLLSFCAKEIKNTPSAGAQLQC